MKVLDLTEFYSPRGGGVRTYLNAKARWFADHEAVRHVIVVPGPRNARRSLHGSTVYEVGGLPAPLSPGYHLLTRAAQVRWIVSRERPDVVELGSAYLAPWVLRRATTNRAIPTVGFLHMDLVGVATRALPRWTPDAVTGAVGGALAAYLRRAYARCRLVIVASDVARQAAATAGVAHTRVVPLGVDTACFRPDRRDPAWRTALGVADDRPIGLYVGRLSAERNVGILLRALPELYRRTGLLLVCVGDGHLRRECERVAAEHSDRLAVLPFEPRPERLARIYASADLFLAPFPHETFGLAALEAAASGLPVVTASSGAVAARAHPAHTFTFAPAAVPELVAAVEAALTGDRGRARAAARRSAEGHSWTTTCARLLDVYDEAVASGA